ncbi:MAG: nucleotidyltransferase family protein [Clostridiales bacterium]|jgi:glucose-1-phosphate thymidylyltransferase|nr:nucleotidyltransferase family protein [Clostridiales bacterium]
MKAIILVAGYATRMYPLTLDRPKALLPLNGKPVINYIVEQIHRLPGVETIYVVSNNKFFAHFDAWQKETASAIPIEVLNDGTNNENDRRGAIGDISFTLSEKKIDDDVFIVAGDNYFTYDLREQYDLFRNTGCDTICAARLDDRERLKAFAVAVLREDGRVMELIEKPEDPPSDIAIYASYFYNKSTLPLFERYLSDGNMPDAPGYFVQWLHKIKDVRAYIMNGECYDIGTIAEYEAVGKMLTDKYIGGATV